MERKIREDETVIGPGESLDDLEIGGLKIIQDGRLFKFGMDAVLLAAFGSVRAREAVADLGTGNGIIPLLLWARYGPKSIYGLEIQEAPLSLAKRSAALNGLTERISLIQGDIREAVSVFGRRSMDAVFCNPPYMDVPGGLKNPNSALAVARHEICCTLQDVLSAAAGILRPGGRFYMVHRPHRLAEIIAGMVSLKLEPKRMRMVHPFRDRPANMVLLEGVLGGGRWMKTEPPLILYESPGRFTEEVLLLYGKETPGQKEKAAGHKEQPLGGREEPDRKEVEG